MRPIEELINPRISLEVLQLLRSRGWTTTRVARSLHVGQAFVDAIAEKTKSFLPEHIRILARAEHTTVERLFFDAMEPAALKSKHRTMWQSTRRALKASDAFRAALHVEKPKKRRARAKTTTKAA